jgi:hypothetical protein
MKWPTHWCKPREGGKVSPRDEGPSSKGGGSNMIRQKYSWLQARNTEKLCRQSQPQNEESEPNALVKSRVPPPKDSYRRSRSFQWSDQGNRYLQIAMDYFTKWPEAYAIPNHEASTVAEALVTNYCRFGVPRELYSNQGRNFVSRLIQKVLQRLGVDKTRTAPLHL